MVPESKKHLARIQVTPDGLHAITRKGPREIVTAHKAAGNPAQSAESYTGPSEEDAK